jgi:penicillin-binding protein 2
MASFITIKNQQKEHRLFTQRIWLITVGIAVSLILLILRLIYLQIYEHERFSTLSENNQIAVIPIEPVRGLIYDRNGILIAENIPAFSLDIIPYRIKNFNQLVEQLNKIVPIYDTDVKDFYRLLKQKRRFEPVPLKLNLTESEAAKFAVNQWRFPGIVVNARLMRHYPLGEGTSHLLGYLGRINTQELKELDPTNYSATNFVGKTGIEKFYEAKLHGTVGYQQVEIDAGGHIVRVLNRTPPIAGETLQLSIDSNLQNVAQNALGSNHGAVIAIEPSTGHVLALVSTPGFDPNQLVHGLNSKDFQTLQNSPDRPLFNRVLRGLYPPGSTVKPFLGIGNLLYGVYSPNYSISCPGYFSFGGHIYLDWKHKGHGSVNQKKAVTVSCDTYYYNLALAMGIDRLHEILTKFGLGQKTGIDLYDELTGVVPSAEWKFKHTGSKWYKGDTLNSGIGQGYTLVTPLQLASGVAAIAARGIRYQPLILLKSITPNNEVTKAKPVIKAKVDVPEASMDLIIQAMENVITTNEGTGYRFGRDAPYSVAAKTGTAQVFTNKNKARGEHDEESLPVNLRSNSLFIAFAPVEDPKIAVAVLVEHSTAASMVARALLDYYLLHANHTNNEKQK